jgi:hypothetical protein
MTAGPGTDRPEEPSAEELRNRIDDLQAQHEHGASEGDPDPLTAKNSPGDVGSQGEGFEHVETPDPVTRPAEEG